MEYSFSTLEARWRAWWQEQRTYEVSNESTKPKCYVLDMFPYPSGAGLHVGHPLGYIASDIYARYKRLQGFNVLHPMGFDAFGLPAEQYALETGQHPAVTTEKNAARYREQLELIGLSFDWSRELRTSDPEYYQWTQWIFTKLFHAWYDRKEKRTRPIQELKAIFEQEGNASHPAPGDEALKFSAEDWQALSPEQQREALMHYRIAYLDYAQVWWCEALGTVLANDEVINGFSERGGHPCVRKKMRQWMLRITEYADRLLERLDHLDWTEAMKDMQRNWIGKSTGAEIRFDVVGEDQQSTENKAISVFTTRPDTIFGVDFLVLAPEHELVQAITLPEQQQAVEEYLAYVQTRSERDRMAEARKVTGAFTGAYARHPFSGKVVPIWIAEYVLIGYGTGAIMAVPSGDERDYAFAKHFSIPITNIFGDAYTGEEAHSAKSGTLSESDFLNGMDIPAAAATVVARLEASGIGKARIRYRLHDAGFSRQRYWGEPFPVFYKDGQPYTIDEPEVAVADQPELAKLPVTLPHLDSYRGGPEGQGPLANATAWVNTAAGERETNTMPGYAGSSWYFFRFMDPHNPEEFASRQATDYWKSVDLYVGGAEHAVGHLLYARMWTKALHDLGYVGVDEPFKKLVNQGMIQGSSRFAFLDRDTKTFHTYHKEIPDHLTPIRVAVEHTDGTALDIAAFKEWRPEYEAYNFETTPDGAFHTKAEVEKMSKSKYNVVNPDDIVARYGADTFRMYEMFLGPLDMSKPWDTQGIEGVHRFLKKLWRLYYGAEGWQVSPEGNAPDEGMRSLHKTIKKVGEDIERFALNTAVSQLMILVNELTDLQCHHSDILEPLATLMAPFAPHLAEQLWQDGFKKEGSVHLAQWPAYDEALLVANTLTYPVAINGKTRAELVLPAESDEAAVREAVLANETVLKWLEGKEPRRIIFVKGRMVNVVL